MTRYFITPYLATFGMVKGALLLTTNDKGNTPNKEWLLDRIKEMNPGKRVSIMAIIEVSKEEYDKHMTS
jgi:hypothetical protein